MSSLSTSFNLMAICCNIILVYSLTVSNPGGGDSHMKVTGMLVGKLELNPQRRPIWAWFRRYLTPKRDHAKTDNQIRASVILNALKIHAKD